MTNVQPAKNWVSQVGVAWALDEAPCPHELLATLIAIARRAGQDGKGSRQSVGTISEKVGKSTRQIKRDIARLCSLGLLLEGDQSLVEGLPAGQRPVVYDVPITLRGSKPGRVPRGSRGDVDVTGDVSATSDVGVHSPVTSTSLEGCHPRPFTGDVHVTQIRSEKEVEEEVEQSLSSTAQISPSEPEREISPTEHSKHPHHSVTALKLLASHGVGIEEAEAVIPFLVETYDIRVVDAWLSNAAKNGTLGDRVHEARRAFEKVQERGIGNFARLIAPRLGDGTSTQDQTPEDWRQSLSEAPSCPDGVPGGDLPRPNLGTATCPICRRRQAQGQESVAA